MNNTENKDRAGRAQLEKDKAGRKARNAERAREEAEKGQPPMVCLGTLPNSHAAMYYATKRRETIGFKFRDLVRANLQAKTKASEWRAFFNKSEDTSDEKIFELAKYYLLDAANESKTYDPLFIRRGGLWEEVVDGELGLIWNAGSACYFLPHEGGENRKMRKVPNLQKAHVYDSGLTGYPCPAAAPLSYEDGRALLDFFQFRQWEMESSKAAEIYLGAIVNGMLSGVVGIRPNAYIIAPSKTGKSELRKDTRRALGKIALHFSGKVTEPSVRRDCDGNAQLALNDEFVKNATKAGREVAEARMETMRNSHDSEDGIAKLCGENKQVQNFVLLNSFLCYATAFPSDDPQDLSRFFIMRLKPWPDSDERLKLWEKQNPGREMVTRPGFNEELLMRVMWEYPNIKQNMQCLQKCLLAQRIEARRAVQLAHVLAGAYSVTQGGIMDEAAIENAVDVAQAYTDSETGRNEAIEYMEVILSHVIERGSNGHLNVRQLCQTIIRRINEGEPIKRFWAQETLHAYGMSYSKKDDCLLIKMPLHPDVAKLYKDIPQWEGGNPVRIVGAGSKENPNSLGLWKKDSANVGGNRCAALCVPRSFFGADEDDDE